MAGPDLALCGWRLSASLDLDGLPPWTGAPDQEPDVRLEKGTIAGPAAPGDSRLVDSILQPDGGVLVQVPRIGRFLVCAGGSRIVADLDAGAAPGALRTAVLGPVLGVLCYQRGVTPLHANTILIDGCAIALGGGSGVGKSTLAAVLIERGHRPFADDVMPIVPGEGWTAALPGTQHLRLWHDSIAFLGRSSDGLVATADDGRAKYHVPIAAIEPARPVPLALLVRLARAQPHKLETPQLLSGIDRTRAILQCLYRRSLAVALAQRGNEAAADISLPGVAVIEYRRRPGLDRLNHAADQIERLARDIPRDQRAGAGR